MPINCQIITQEKTVFDEPVDIVTAPSVMGEMGIMPNHAPIIAVLDFGELKVRQGGEEKAFAIGGGIIEVTEERVIVLADAAEQSNDIDLQRAEEARQRAQKIMTEGPPEDPAEFAALEQSLRLANLRLKVARRNRAGSALPTAGRTDE